jgi:cytochrome c
MQSKTIRSVVAASGALLLAAVAFSNTTIDAVAGRAAFEKRCTGCHALDRDRVGPRLSGVVGRKAGAVSAFPYSDAVKKSAVVWNEAALDKWLTDPDSMIPDSDMAFRLDNPAERAAIIAFLKETGK